jgi:hypothetical protein
MKIGDLIKCVETGRVGVILEIRRVPTATMVLIEWPGGPHWVDATDIQVI